MFKPFSIYIKEDQYVVYPDPEYYLDYCLFDMLNSECTILNDPYYFIIRKFITIKIKINFSHEYFNIRFRDKARNKVLENIFKSTEYKYPNIFKG